MPLNKQKVQLSIVDGLDTKTDEKNVLATKFLELENVVFTQTGSLTKRNGYNILSTNKTADAGSLARGLGLATFKNELLHFDGEKLHSYVKSLDKWAEKGSVVSVITETQSVINNSFEQSAAEFGTSGNISIYAWEDSRGGVRYSAIDNGTGNFIVSDVEISATASEPKVVPLGSSILIIYKDAGNVNFVRIDPVSPDVVSAPTVFITNLGAGELWDITPGGERLFFAWENDTGGISVFFLTTAFVQSSEIFIPGEVPADVISITCDCQNNIHIYYYDGVDIRVVIRNYDNTSEILAPTTIETIANVAHITAIETDAATNTQTVLYEIDNPTNNNFIRKNTITNAGVVGTPEDFLRSVGLYSQAFGYLDQQYVVSVFNSDIQATYFVHSLQGDLIAKLTPNNAGGYVVGQHLVEVSETSDGIFNFALLKKHSLSSDNGNLFTLTGVQGGVLDFASNNKYLNVEMADNLHIVGGVLQIYDGKSVVEQGFSYFPEGVQVSLGAGGGLQAGSYQYVAVYAWMDNFGQIHRSAPSIPLTVTAAAGQSATVTIPTMRITKKENVFIEVYGTEANGTTFYKLTDVSAPLYNDKTVDTLQFVDTETDANKIDNEVLYTTGGVVDNISAESCSLITTYKSRIVIGGLEDKNTIQYSKERFEGFPVEFNDDYKVTVDAKGGDITALANLDDFVIIFKNRAIFAFSGEGPNNLGEQNDFRPPQLVTADTGCTDSNSVVEIDPRRWTGPPHKRRESLMKALLIILMLAGAVHHVSAQNTFESKEGDTTYVMQEYYMVYLIAGENRDGDSTEVAEIQAAHLGHLNRMAEEGHMSIAGPFGDEGDVRGICIYNTATQEEAEKYANMDPAVKAGRLKVEVRPWWAAKGARLQ